MLARYPAALQQSRKECGAGLYGLLGIGRQDKDKKEKQIRKNFEFFGAPTVMFVFVHGDLGVYSALDAGILLQTIMLAAQTHGVWSYDTLRALPLLGRPEQKSPLRIPG